MESLEWALERVTADIERLQPELQRLQQEMERLQQQRAALLGAQEVIKQLSGTDTSIDHQQHQATNDTTMPLIDETEKILRAHGQALSPAQLRAELAKANRHVTYNVLSSLLSRESRKPVGARIRNVGVGRYVATTEETQKEEGTAEEMRLEGQAPGDAFNGIAEPSQHEAL